MHKLALGKRFYEDELIDLGSGDHAAATQAAVDLFNICAEYHTNLDIKGVSDGCSFEVPILRDMYGETAID